MKTIYKIITLALLILVVTSCKDDEQESMSIQEKLLGKWKTLTYTENGSTPDTFTTCDLSDNYTYTNTEITVEDFSVVDDSCIVDDNFSYTYTLNGNMMRANNIDIEILEITETFMKVKSIVNNGNTTKVSTFEKVNE